MAILVSSWSKSRSYIFSCPNPTKFERKKEIRTAKMFKNLNKVQNPKFDKNGEEIILRGSYKIDTNFWLSKLGIKESENDRRKK